MESDNGKIGFSIELDNSQLNRDIKKSQQAFKELGDQVKNDYTSVDNVFKNLGKTIAATFTIQKSTEFIHQIVKVRGEIESLEKTFEILAGKDLGGKLFSEIKDFAVKTPMAMGDLAKGAQTMLAFNMEAQNVMPILRAIGDISMGNSQKFNSLVLAFSQMQSTGKLMGQDLLQMINAGFNPLAVISEKTGKSIGDLKEEMSAGTISADMITRAFMDATSEGGKFYGMLESQSKTIEGSISNLEGAIEEMFNSIGEKHQDIITETILSATELVNNYEKVGKTIGELVATYGLYKAAVISLSVVEKLRYQAALAQMAGMTKMQAIVDILRTKTEALNIVMAKNPYVLAGIAIAALGVAIYKLATYQTDAEKSLKKLNEAEKENNKEIASQQIEIDRLFIKLKNAKEGTDEYKRAKQAIINQYGGYLEGLNSEIQSLQDVEGAYRAVSEAAKDAARARAMESASKQAADDYAEKEAQAREDIYTALQKKFKDQKGADGRSLVETYYAQILGTIGGNGEVDEKLLKKFDKARFVVGDPMTGAGSYHYTTNAITDALNSIKKAQDVYDKTMEAATIKFGEKKGSQTTDDSKKPAPTENKKYWEDYIKEQQGLLNAMTQAELQSKKADEIRSNIIDAQFKLSNYEVHSPASGKRTLAQMLAEIEAAENDTHRVVKHNSQERIALDKEIHFEQEQNRINLEKDAMKRREMQMQLDNDKELYNIEKQRDRAISAEIARQKAVFDAKEKEKKAANKDYVVASFSDADIDQSQIADIEAKYAVLTELVLQQQNERNKQVQREDARAMNEYLKEYGTYLEKRNAIIALYNEEMSNATSEGEKLTISERMRRDLSNLDIEANKTTSAISKLFGDMTNKTVADMRTIADQAQSALDFLIAGEWDEQKGLEFGMTKETFETLRQSPEELEKIRNGIRDCRYEADQAEGAFGKMANGLKKLFDAGNDANKTKQALSEIESGLSDVLDLASFLSDSLSSLGEAFGNDTLTGIADGINVAVDAASSAMSGAQAGSMFGPWGAAAGAAIGLVGSLVTSIAQLHDKKHEKKIQSLQGQIDVLERSYDKLAKSVEDAFSKDVSKMIEQQNTLLEQQKILIQQQIAEEKSKKNSDSDRIKEWEQQIEDIDELIADNKEKAVDAIFGEDLKSAIENFSDAYAEAWASGSNKAQAAKDVVKKMMQQMVTESIKAAIQSSTKMEKIRAKLQEFYADNVLTDWEQDYIYKMAEELQKELDSQFGWADGLMSGGEASNQSGTKKGFEAMNQETASELNGRFTAMQLNSEQIKVSVLDIGVDVKTIRGHIQANSAALDEIRNVSVLALGHLEDISRNTYELFEINERLGKIEKNTRNL